MLTSDERIENGTQALTPGTVGTRTEEKALTFSGRFQSNTDCALGLEEVL